MIWFTNSMVMIKRSKLVPGIRIYFSYSQNTMILMQNANYKHFRTKLLWFISDFWTSITTHNILAFPSFAIQNWKCMIWYIYCDSWYYILCFYCVCYVIHEIYNRKWLHVAFLMTISIGNLFLWMKTIWWKSQSKDF